MRIAIVEDDRIDLEQLYQTLIKYCNEHEISCQLETFTSEENFLQNFSSGKFDIIFLDNYIGNTLGVNLANQIRKEDTKTAFVFVTMSPDFAIESYDIGALHYIIKPITRDAIAKVFQRWEANRRTPHQTIELMINRTPVHIPVDTILYIETLDKVCTIHCKTQNLNIYISLDKLMKLLPEDTFLRPYRSFILNMNFIERMTDHAFILKNGENIPASRLIWSETKQKYMDFLLEKH